MLELVQRGCLKADFHTAIEPASAQAHADLARILPPSHLFDFRSLGEVLDSTCDYMALPPDASAGVDRCFIFPLPSTRAMQSSLTFSFSFVLSRCGQVKHGEREDGPFLAIWSQDVS